ncbi:MAG: TetR/AcrR family transcriptional regulator [Deltaproteobacteria bacterium]|nr:TetR/AcrR family transcriptional regulator [Deltaproteobacteria bacterium]
MQRDIQEDPSAGSLRERQRAETRERLFQAALDEIRREGVVGAQVDRIVASIGVARSTFYFHFPTKEDVLVDYDRRRELEIVGLLQAVLQHGAPLRLALTGIVTAFTAIESVPSERRLLLETVALHVRRMAVREGHPLIDELERIVEAARDRGEVRDDLAARDVALLFMGNLVGFLIGLADRGRQQPSPGQLIEAFLGGVEARR